MTLPVSHRSHRGAAAAWVAAGFLVLTLIITWPLATNITTSVLGPPGDNYYFAWLIGWSQKALFELGRLPQYVPQLNYPEGWNLAYNEMTPVMVLVALPLAVFGGPMLGYNGTVVMSFVLSGLGVYLWVWRLTRNRGAAVVAGALFAFAPYRMSHVQGHLNLAGTQWLPFYLMALHDALKPASSAKSAVWAALFLGLIGCTSMYYLYMALVLTVAYAVAHWLWLGRRDQQPHAWWKRLALLAVTTLPVAVLCAAPYLQIAREGQVVARSLAEASYWSASPTDFLFPSPAHPILGTWARTNFDLGRSWESTIYVGAAALLLAWVAVRQRRLSHSGLVCILACVAMVAAVLAMGIYLNWGHQCVTVPVPRFLHRWLPATHFLIPLPGYWMFRFLPFGNQLRVWMRYGIWVSLCVSVLAGLGLASVLKRVRRGLKFWVALGALLLVLLDFYPGRLPVSRIVARASDHWLADQSGEGAVAEFPIEWSTKPTLPYYTLVNDKSSITGFFAPGPTPQLQRIQPVLGAFPDRASVELLHQLGVQWVCVDSGHYRDFQDMHARIEGLGLRLAFVGQGRYVYELGL